MKKKKSRPAAKRRSDRNAGWREAAAALGIVAAAVALILLIRHFGTPGDPKNPDDTAPPVSVSLPEWERTPLTLDGVSLPLAVGEAVSVTALASTAGTYPEDAGDEPVTDVLTASFTNTSDRTVEYLTAILTLNGEEYRFAVSTIPPGATVCAFESAKKNAPDTVTSAKAEKEYLLWFESAPSLHGDAIRTEVKNGTITVTNISDKPITEDIVIYYKSVYGDSYLGGITYRLRAEGGLDAGASYDGYAPHALAGRTEVLFVDYE